MRTRPANNLRPAPMRIRAPAGDLNHPVLPWNRGSLMSETIPDGTPALHAVPDPAPPLAALTGAHAAIYAHLTCPTSTKGVTAAELALATGLGRSTAGKALAVLEDAGLAYR